MKEMRASLGSSNQISTWSLEKKYAAALFFLNRVPSPIVSEAQYHRLHALMLQIAYGSYVASGRLPEFSNCSATDRRKRENEWKAVQHLPKVPAMKQFIDLMNELHPNWHKHKRIFEEFEVAWIEERYRMQSKQSSEQMIRREKESVHDRLYSQSMKNALSKERSVLRAPNIITAAISELQQYDDKRFREPSPKLPKLSATLDAVHTLSSLKISENPKEVHDVVSESRYYHLQSPKGFKPEEDFQHAKDVLENYFGSINSGKGSLSESGKKPVFEIHSDIEKSLSLLLQRLETIKSSKLDSSKLKFPLSTAAQLESFLRPKLEIQTVVLTHLEEVVSTSLGPSKNILGLICNELMEAIDSMFEYLYDLENSMKDLGSQSKGLEKDSDAILETIDAMQELYSVENNKLDLFGFQKEEKSHYQMEVANGMVTLRKKPAESTLKKLEEILSMQKTEYFNLESKLSAVEVERDKLIDELRLVQQSAYSDNIALANITKDLKRSVGIIRGGEGRGTSHELALKKELEELKKELRELKLENDSLRKLSADIPAVLEI